MIELENEGSSAPFAYILFVALLTGHSVLICQPLREDAVEPSDESLPARQGIRSSGLLSFGIRDLLAQCASFDVAVQTGLQASCALIPFSVPLDTFRKLDQYWHRRDDYRRS
ncbi:hypothetical protein [Rhizobium sp. BK696]|uniref:hypothetical protein n=1 Tax=Rhizobium sp. Rhizsp82 TaxID=3243057 RepID=UPI0010297A02